MEEIAVLNLTAVGNADFANTVINMDYESYLSAMEK